MERLTHDADFGLEDWEETLFFIPSDPNGAYNILDIAKYQGEEEFDKILINIAIRLAEIEDILGDDYDLDRLCAVVDILRPDRAGEPLTIEQLRQMDGLPVYVVPANHDPEGTGWCVVEIWKNDKESSAMMSGVDYWRWKFDTYGEEWTAYAYPLEQDATQPASEFIERAEKELQKAANDLEQAVRRGAPHGDIFNLQRKVEYKQYVLGLLKGR